MKFALASFVTYIAIVGVFGSMFFVSLRNDGDDVQWWWPFIFAAVGIVGIAGLLALVYSISVVWEWAV